MPDIYVAFGTGHEYVIMRVIMETIQVENKEPMPDIYETYSHIQTTERRQHPKLPKHRNARKSF
jgi:hypothetical protein